MKDKKIQQVNYDTLILWDFTRACHLKCHYCFFDWKQYSLRQKIKELFTYKDLRKEKAIELKVDKLLNTLSNHDRSFLIQLTGGEPFLSPNIIEASKRITQNHYLDIVSSFTAPKVKIFLNELDKDKVNLLIISLHISELKRLSLENIFMDNLLLAKEKGFNFVVNVVVHPSMYDEIELWQDKLAKNEIELGLTSFKGFYKGKKYPEAYSVDLYNRFDIKDRSEKYYRKGTLCGAGYNIFVIDVEGKVSSCFAINDERGDLSNINFASKPITCPVDKCSCLFPEYHKHLISIAVNSTKSNE